MNFDEKIQTYVHLTVYHLVQIQTKIWIHPAISILITL